MCYICSIDVVMDPATGYDQRHALTKDSAIENRGFNWRECFDFLINQVKSLYICSLPVISTLVPNSGLRTVSGANLVVAQVMATQKTAANKPRAQS